MMPGSVVLLRIPNIIVEIKRYKDMQTMKGVTFSQRKGAANTNHRNGSDNIKVYENTAHIE